MHEAMHTPIHFGRIRRLVHRREIVRVNPVLLDAKLLPHALVESCSGQGIRDRHADVRGLELARELEPADIGVSVSYPLPGTGFYERVRQELGVKQNWIDSNDLATMYKATYAPEVYRRVHGLVHHEFRARKSANALKQVARSPQQFRPAHVRKAAS